MFPLPAVQGYNRVPGIVTLAFVKVKPGASVGAVAEHIDVRPARADDDPDRVPVRPGGPSLVYLQAAVNGSTVLAILIGAVIVGNTMLLSLFERTREFGLLRAVGWTRRRTVGLLLGESLLLALVGARASAWRCPSSSSAVSGAACPQLRGVLHPDFTRTPSGGRCSPRWS